MILRDRNICYVREEKLTGASSQKQSCTPLHSSTCRSNSKIAFCKINRRFTSAQRGQARSPWASCPSSSWQVIAISLPVGNGQLPEASSFARPGHASIVELCCSSFGNVTLLLFLLFWWEGIIRIGLVPLIVCKVNSQTILKLL